MHINFWIIAWLSLTSIIIIHEAGHFTLARLCKVKVLRFCIGFGPILWSRYDKKGTEFALAAIPLGGYISMLQQDNLTSTSDSIYCLDYKPLWQKILIVLAGPGANFLTAIIFFSVAFLIGTPGIAPVVGEVKVFSLAYQAGIKSQHEIIAINNLTTTTWGEVKTGLIRHRTRNTPLKIKLRDINTDKITKHSVYVANTDVISFNDLGITPYIPVLPAVIGKVISPLATKAGLQEGDLVTKINQQPIANWQELVKTIQSNPNKLIQLSILRNQQSLNLPIRPQPQQDKQNIGVIGVGPPPINWPQWMLRTTHYSLLSAITMAGEKTVATLGLIIESLQFLLTGKVSIDQLAGPIGIAKLTGESSQAGIAALLIVLAMLSINIGLINLLPIPVLDGGHLVYYLLEFTLGVKIAAWCRKITMPVGLLLLLFLTAIAIMNDINNL